MIADVVSRPSIVVSACLLGHHVRYDGGHQRNDWLCQQLAHQVTLLPLCPETGIGLATPRPPIQLYRINGRTRLLQRDDHRIDHSQAMREFARAQARALAGTLCGAVVKSRSPSCGLRDVPLSEPTGAIIGDDDSGLFTTVLRQTIPHLPVIDETGLQTDAGQQRFRTGSTLVHAWNRIDKDDRSAILAFHEQVACPQLSHIDRSTWIDIEHILSSMKSVNKPGPIPQASRYIECLLRMFSPCT